MLTEEVIKHLSDLKLDRFPKYCLWYGSIVRTKMLCAVWLLMKEKPLKILDIGCGTAKIWKPLLENTDAVQVYGIDPFYSDAEAAKNTLPPGKAYIEVGSVSDLQKIFPEVEEFDVIVSHSVLEHVVPRDLYFGSINDRLTDDGVALISWGCDHFRQGLRTDIRNKISELLAVFGNEKYYAKKVDFQWALESIDKAGLKVDFLHHYSIVELKRLSRMIEEGQRDRVFQDWIAIEEILNNSVPNMKDLDSRLDECMTVLTKIDK